jgi:tetratricopeptide (TPR) repeat protein
LTSAADRIKPAAYILIFLLAISSCSTKPDESAEVYTRRLQADSLLVQGYNQSDMFHFNPAWASFNQALNIYASLDNREGMIDALLAMGRTRRITGDIEAAVELYAHAGALAEYSRNPDCIRSVLNHQADLALREGNPVQALDLLADRENESTTGRERSAQLRLRGSVEYALGNQEKAFSLLLEAVQVAEAAEEHVAAAQAYYKLASIASLGARFDEAEDWALKALKEDKIPEYVPGIASDLRALAIISEKSENKEAAEDYYRRAWLAYRALGRDDDAESARKRLENLTGTAVTVP